MEKMIAGKNFDGLAPEMVAARISGYTVTKEFNEAKEDERMQVLGKVCTLKKNAVVHPQIRFDYGTNTTIGENSVLEKNCVILDGGPVTIGDNTIIHEDTSLLTVTHPVDSKPRLAMIQFTKPITVGNNCVVGRSVTFCPGSGIGDNSIVAPNSIITKVLPGNCYIAGNPARVIKEINHKLSEAEINELIK